MLSLFQSLFVGSLSNLDRPVDNALWVASSCQRGLLSIVGTLLPLFLVLFLVALFAGVVQVGWVVSPEVIFPRLQRVNLLDLSHAKRLLSLQGLVRLFLALVKIVVVAAVVWEMATALMSEAIQLTEGSPQEFASFVFRKSISLGLVLGLVLALLGLGDWLFQRWKFLREMRMTKHEVQEEQRQSEGGGEVKAARKMRRHAFDKGDLEKQLSLADVLLMNSFPYAIAVRYDAATMTAPLCLAKGAGRKAEAMERLAVERRIPVVKDLAMAKELYRSLEAGERVPQAFYGSVAAVLAKAYETPRP